MKEGLLSITKCALVLALVAFTAVSTRAQHNVPDNRQDGDADCGPAAAASCLKWFQQNGWPQLQTKDGKTGIKDYEHQLEVDAGTDDKGTWAYKLRDAMNKLVDGTIYKGQLRAKGAPSSAYKSFAFLDDEFSHDEDILLLLRWTDAEGKLIDHYVTVKNITGSDPSRAVTYMDPLEGTSKTGTLTVGSDGKLQMTHDGQVAKIASISTMSPANTTTTSASPVDPADPSKGTNITYTVYYPSFRKTMDTHVWVKDCNKSNYTVSGLPAGWSWDVKTVGNKCYLSFWKGSSPNDIPNGSTVTVTYTGPRKVERRKRIVTPTTGGTASPTDSAQPAEGGHTVISAFAGNPPARPGGSALDVISVTPEYVSAMLTWDAASDTSVSGYHVYSVNTGEFVTETTSTQLMLDSLEADAFNEFVVAAANDDGAMLSDDSAPVSVYLDAIGATEIVPGGPQEIRYVPPLYSGDDPVQWRITLPGASSPGKLYVLTLTGRPVPALPSVYGTMHEHYFRLWADVPLSPGPISLEVPYDGVYESRTQKLLALIGGVWTNVTTRVDPVTRLVFGDIPSPTTIALVGRASHAGRKRHFREEPGLVSDEMPNTVEGPVRFELRDPDPNPFNRQTNIEYSLSEGGFVNLAIYDVRGRLVKTLVNEEKPRGRHSITWGALSKSGEKVSSGIYFVRFKMDIGVEIKKVVVLK